MNLKQLTWRKLTSTLAFALGMSAVVVCSTGCQTLGPSTATGGALGALTGGLTGAAIGSYDGKASEGALIGAVAGGTLGGVAGNAVDRSVERDRIDNQIAIQQQRQNAISVEQVVQMTQSGLGSNVIASQINSQGVVNRPTIDQLIFLKNNGVDDLVIQSLQSAPVAGYGAVNSQPFIRQQIIRHDPVYVGRCGPRPHYGYHYRRGRRPRAGFSVNF